MNDEKYKSNFFTYLRNSEAAAEKQRAIEAKEARERIEAELAELKKEKALAEHKAKFLANGYSDELASSSAKALLDGDFDTFFKNQATYQTEMQTKIKSDMIAKTSYPQGGGKGGHNAMTLKELRSLSFAERTKWASEHPEEYKLLYSNGG
jgi:molybdopterin converting factor small subunit